ncbi:hypothetical protein BRD19_03600 [Halobacteriales archaeon SW_7_65_23]|nr:MAG: hypothetical protein BRD19_03600 [Halobacteriales archaeon SW_7_65_23]
MPWTARQIATAVGTDLASTVQRLEQLLGEDELVALDLEGQRRYYPDPIQSYLDATGGEPTDATERAALQSVEEAVTEWERSIAVQSVEGFMRYHHATRLVASSLLGRGFDVFDADWDVLVVLDTCRVDALRAVVDRLDGVETLRRNVDGTIAITADHGEAFGEHGEYGHRPAMLHPEVRQVPWVTVEATDEGTREGDLSAYEPADRDVSEQLDALGYR